MRQTVTPAAARAPRAPFRTFYREQFLPEHAHPVNRAFHFAGTVAGLAFVPLILMSPLPWLVVLFPAVHAIPGLIGHRLFERNQAVGDLRVLRTDAPSLWFIAGNHLMFLDSLRGRLPAGVGRGG